MSLENIRKIWVLIGSVLTALNLAFMPEWLNNLFSVEGTGYAFAAATAVITLWQFVSSRTGEAEDGEPQAYSTGEKSKVAYLLNPFKAAA